MRKRSWLTLSLVLLWSVALLLSGCSSGGGSTPPNQPPGGSGTKANPVIKIGVSISMSGPLAREGGLMKQGYELWRDVVNDKGGLDVAGAKHKVELVFYDDKSDASTSTKLVEKLISEDKVQFMFGPFGSGISKATGAIGEKYKVITIAPMANADSVYEGGFKHFFGVIPSASKGLAAHVVMLSKLEPKPKKVVVITPDDLFPLAGADGAVKMAKSLGMDVEFHKYPKGATDLSSLLTSLKASNPDVVLNAGYFQDFLTTMKQSKEVKLNAKYFGGVLAVQMPDWSKSLGKDAEYTSSYSWWSPDLKFKGPLFGTSQEYGATFEKKFGFVPDYNAAAASAGGLILQMAIEKAGSVETEKVRQALSGTKTETFFGTLEYDATGKNIAGDAVLIQQQNGKAVTIWPTAAAQAKPVYPIPAWDKR